MKGFPAHLLVSFFLIVKEGFKTSELGRHVGVDFKVARDDLLHLADVVIHVLVYDRSCLHA